MDSNPGPDTPNRGIPSAPHHYGPQQHPSTSYRFSNEEMRVLRQCNRDSFYQRCLPLATILGVGTYYGVQSGYLKSHSRWGATPKVTVAAIVGYFLGKFSYQSKCAEMLMRLPNSQLGEALRQKKLKGGFQEAITLDPSLSLPPFADVETYSDVGPHHEIDMDRPYPEGLDDSRRPTVDSPIFEDEGLPAGTQTLSTTYEELRRKNREEYEQKKTKPFRGVTSSEDVPAVIRPRGTVPDMPSSPPPTFNREKNQYGDIFRPLLERFGGTFDYRIISRGYYPRGGGEVHIRVKPVTELKAVTLTESGHVVRIWGWAFVAGSLPIKVAHLMADSAVQTLRKSLKNVDMKIERYKENPDAAVGTGSGINIFAETSTGCLLGGSALGKRELRAEEVGRKAADELLQSVNTRACVDSYAQDQMILLMAIAHGKSRVKCGPITLHTQTAIHIAHQLTEAKFTVINDGPDSNIVECEGIGLKNSA